MMWRASVTSTSPDGRVWVECPALSPGTFGPLPVLGAATCTVGDTVSLADHAGPGAAYDLIVMGVIP